MTLSLISSWWDDNRGCWISKFQGVPFAAPDKPVLLIRAAADEEPPPGWHTVLAGRGPAFFWRYAD